MGGQRGTGLGTNRARRPAAPLAPSWAALTSAGGAAAGAGASGQEAAAAEREAGHRARGDGGRSGRATAASLAAETCGRPSRLGPSRRQLGAVAQLFEVSGEACSCPGQAASCPAASSSWLAAKGGPVAPRSRPSLPGLEPRRDSASSFFPLPLGQRSRTRLQSGVQMKIPQQMEGSDPQPPRREAGAKAQAMQRRPRGGPRRNGRGSDAGRKGATK